MDHLLSTASTAETATIANSVATAVTNAAIEDSYLSEQKSQLKSNADTMISGIGSSQRKQLKMEVDAADNRRDSLHFALKNLLKGYMYWNKPETAPAAFVLYQILEDHGKNITKTSQEKQSAMVDSILKRYEDKSEEINTLSLSELVANYSAAQTNFKTLYQQSAKLESEKDVVIAPSNIRKDVIRQINKVIDFLTVMVDVNQPVYGGLATTIEQLVEDINIKIRTRQSLGKTEEQSVE